MSFWRRLFNGSDDVPQTVLHEESRRLGAALGQIFTRVESTLTAGITTVSINEAVAAHIVELGVSASFRERGFPGCCTTSIDDEIINAPPSDRRLANGQLLKLQIGIKGKRTYAMQGWTYAIGPADDEATRFMAAGTEALRAAIAATTNGTRVGTVSATIQSRIESDGFTVNRQFIGHGVDTRSHADPAIPGYGVDAHGLRVRSGLILSLNVIAQAGAFDCEVMDDDWTVVTRDHHRAIQFSQLVIVTDGAPEVITVERPGRSVETRASITHS